MTGTFISVVGFGVVGFDYNRLKESTIENAWYQTIHTNDNNFWYGIDLGNNVNLFVIGSSD
jgi:hypothetical protein